MADSSAVISINNIVSSFFVRSSLDTRFKEAVTVIATECVSHLNIYHTQQPREAYLEISDINMCTLPPDWVDNLRPPCIVVNHSLHELSEDLNIPLNSAIDCGSPTNPEPVNLIIGEGYNSRHFPIYRDHNGRGEYGSHPVRNVAFYRIDKEHRVIRLRGHILSNILYIEYISTGIGIDGKTLVPVELHDVVRTYLHWQTINYDKTVPQNEKQSKKKEYEEALDLYNHWKQDYSLKTLLDSIRSQYGQTAKG